MAKNHINQQIEARVREFTEDLTGLIREAAMEAVEEALSGASTTGARRSSTRRTTKKAASRRKAAPARRKGGRRVRRSEDQIKALGEKVMGYISDNPGQRLEEIGQAMKIATAELKRPIANLLDEKALRTTGQKRGTKYFPGKGRPVRKKKAVAKTAAS